MDDYLSNAAREHCAKMLLRHSGEGCMPPVSVSANLARKAIAMTSRSPGGNFRMDPAALLALEKLTKLNERSVLVEHVKLQTETGVYDSDGKKMEVATSNLLDDLVD